MAVTEPGGGGGENFLTKKLGPLPVWVYVAAISAYLFLHKSSSSSSSSTTDPTTATLAAEGAQSLQYGYTGSDLASMLSDLSSQIAMLGGGNMGTSGSGASSPGSTGNPATATATATVNPGGTMAPPPNTVAWNPYAVGTRVAGSESIIQAVYDPAVKAYVDLTSQGGLYTGPGANVTGSAYNPKLQGQTGLREVLTGGGTGVQVYQGSKLLGSYGVK